MENLGDAYAPAIALEGWNYVRYLGPFTGTPPQPVFLCVEQGKLVVATGREPSKLWYINRLRAAEDDPINRHACSFKREGTQTYMSHSLSSTDGNGEVALGPQARFDVFRVTRMKKPCHIQVYQEPPPPPEECCSESGDITEGEGTNNEETGTDAEVNEEPVLRPPPIEWYLGISSDFKVVLKPVLPVPESSPEIAGQKPIWELTSREEAAEQDHPTIVVPAVDPSRGTNPRRKEYYLHPDRFKVYDRDFWPSNYKPT